MAVTVTATVTPITRTSDLETNTASAANASIFDTNIYRPNNYTNSPYQVSITTAIKSDSEYTKATIHIIGSFYQEVYRTAKNLFGLPIRNRKCRIYIITRDPRKILNCFIQGLIQLYIVHK